MTAVEISVDQDQWERIRQRNLHPLDWVNPEPRGRYNLVVIGGGTAGLVAAAGAAMLGARVALIERHLLGGDCTNYGCVPSKALLRSARAAHELNTAERYGVRGGGVVDFAAVMQRLRRLRAGISANDAARRFQDLGVDVYFGDAHFTVPRRLRVGPTDLEFRRAIIATGARAAVPPIAGLRETGYLTNETVFSLETLPARLLVLGAGPIGCELAQAFRRLGSEVHVFDRASRLLPRDETDAAEILHRRFEQEGIHLHLSVEVRRVQADGGAKTVVYEQAGREAAVGGDALLVALGRAPNLEGLHLEEAGVESSAQGVRVDDHLRTTNPAIYAAGDICTPLKFTHAAEAMARLALQNALLGRHLRFSSLVIPWCTYTDPEIAHVGMTQPEAERAGAAAFTQPLAEVDRAVLDGDEDGYARLYTRPGGGRVLGATFVGSHAGESIAEAALAVARRLPVSALSAVIHPYPTETEAWKRAADRQLRTRLRPWMRTWLGRYFAWRRGCGGDNDEESHHAT